MKMICSRFGCPTLVEEYAIAGYCDNHMDDAVVEELRTIGEVLVRIEDGLEADRDRQPRRPQSRKW